MALILQLHMVLNVLPHIERYFFGTVAVQVVAGVPAVRFPAKADLLAFQIQIQERNAVFLGIIIHRIVAGIGPGGLGRHLHQNQLGAVLFAQRIQLVQLAHKQRIDLVSLFGLLDIFLAPIRHLGTGHKLPLGGKAGRVGLALNRRLGVKLLPTIVVLQHAELVEYLLTRIPGNHLSRVGVGIQLIRFQDHHLGLLGFQALLHRANRLADQLLTGTADIRGKAVVFPHFHRRKAAVSITVAYNKHIQRVLLQRQIAAGVGVHEPGCVIIVLRLQ